MSIIISIDPGEHTVMLVAHNIDYASTSYDLLHAQLFLFNERQNIFGILRIFESTHYIDAVVIEDFMLFKSKANNQVGSRFETVKVIERITYDCERLGLNDRIVMQSPQLRNNAKGMPEAHYEWLRKQQPDPRLRVHYIAAYRHLRYYVFSQKIAMLKEQRSA